MRLPAGLEVPREPKIVEDGSLGFQVTTVNFRYGHERDVGRVAFLPVPVHHALGVAEVQPPVLKGRLNARKAH
jgi:hypothetical protein